MRPDFYMGEAWHMSSKKCGHARLVTVVLLIAVVTLVGGCGRGVVDDAPVTVEAITQSTSSAGSARMSMTVTMSFPPTGEIRTVLDGVTTLHRDLEQVRAEMSMQVEPAPSGMASGMLRLVDGRIFARGAFTEALGISGASGGWVEVTGEQREAFTQLGMTGTNPTDPTTALDALKAVDGLDVVGQEQVRDVDAERLSATTTMGDLLDAQGVDLQQRVQAQQQLTGEASDGMVDDLVETMRDLPVELDVWVDDQQRLRRSRLRVDMGPMWQQMMPDDSEQEPGEATMVMDMEFYDYGTPVDVDIPDIDTQSRPEVSQTSPVGTPLETPTTGMAAAEGSGSILIDNGPMAGTHDAQGSCITTSSGQGIDLSLHLTFPYEPQRAGSLIVRVPFAEGAQQTRELMLIMADSDGRTQQIRGTANATVDIGPVTQRSAREYVNVKLDGTVEGHHVVGDIHCQPDG